jgi:hypothetical protein
MPNPAYGNIQGTLHVDRYLTGYSVNYVQDRRNFVAQGASSIIRVLYDREKDHIETAVC